jgi:hypothetical protein
VIGRRHSLNVGILLVFVSTSAYLGVTVGCQKQYCPCKKLGCCIHVDCEIVHCQFLSADTVSVNVTAVTLCGVFTACRNVLKASVIGIL